LQRLNTHHRQRSQAAALKRTREALTVPRRSTSAGDGQAKARFVSVRGERLSAAAIVL